MLLATLHFFFNLGVLTRPPEPRRKAQTMNILSIKIHKNMGSAPSNNAIHLHVSPGAKMAHRASLNNAITDVNIPFWSHPFPRKN